MPAATRGFPEMVDDEFEDAMRKRRSMEEALALGAR
jgi:hypothetical protein